MLGSLSLELPEDRALDNAECLASGKGFLKTLSPCPTPTEPLWQVLTRHSSSWSHSA